MGDNAKGDIDNAVGESVARHASSLQGQARLADATGTGEGQQAHVVAPQQRRDLRDLALPSDERRKRHGQYVRVREKGVERGGRGGHGAGWGVGGRVTRMPAARDRRVERIALLRRQG